MSAVALYRLLKTLDPLAFDTRALFEEFTAEQILKAWQGLPAQERRPGRAYAVREALRQQAANLGRDLDALRAAVDSLHERLNRPAPLRERAMHCHDGDCPDHARLPDLEPDG